jgi:MFS superfamily sulfate permease-like transporter
VLGQIPHSDHFRDITLHPEAQTYPGLLIYRFEAALIFPNVAHFSDEIQRYLGQSQSPVTAVLVNAEPINFVDVTGAEHLINLHTRLTSAGIGLYFAQVRDPVMQMLQQVGVEEAVGRDHFFESVEKGVETLKTKNSNSDGFCGYSIYDPLSDARVVIVSTIW